MIKPLTIEDKAAMLLAAAFGAGSGFDVDYGYAKSPRWCAGIDGSESTPASVPAISVAWETETLELAGRLINPRHLPTWIRELSTENQAMVLSWSAANPIGDPPGSPAAARPRESQHWKRAARVALIPKAQSGAHAAAALAIADLPGPLRPLLTLYALEDAEQLEAIFLHAAARGLQPAATEHALRRLLWPANRVRGGKVDDCAIGAGLPREEYRLAYRTAYRVLRKWLHRACVAFVNACGVESMEPHVRVMTEPKRPLAQPQYGGGLWLQRNRTWFGKREWTRIVNEAHRMNESYTNPARVIPAKGVMDRGKEYQDLFCLQSMNSETEEPQHA